MAVDLATSLAALKALYPWMDRIGITPGQIRDWVIEFPSQDAIYQKATESPQYQARFPAIRRADGTLRSDEKGYLDAEEGYAQVMRQFGDPRATYTPADYVALFDNEIDVNEFKDRYTVYDQLKQSGRDVTDSFYVYAGMRISTDDLYQAVVSPEYRQKMGDEYNRAIAAQPLDYQTWITRATEAGLSRVADTLGGLNRSGAVTGEAISQTLSTNPEFARTMMDALYHGGDVATNRTLSLTELMHSFEYAMVGSAATGQGLELPSLERIAAIRNAGIDRAKALESYGQYAAQKNLISGMTERLNRGQSFSQSDFEKAMFLHHAPESDLLAQAAGVEKAAGARQGVTDFSLSKQGQIQQKGLAGAFER